MKKIQVYVETTVFDYFYREDERYTLRREATRKFFDNVFHEKFVALGSDLVMEELENIPDPYKESLLELMERYNLEKIIVDDNEVKKLAKLYIDEKIIPKDKKNIAQHLAIATIGEVDVLVSWNCEVLVNEFKARHLKLVNLKEGYTKELSLRTPEEVRVLG